MRDGEDQPHPTGPREGRGVEAPGSQEGERAKAATGTPPPRPGRYFRASGPGHARRGAAAILKGLATEERPCTSHGWRFFQLTWAPSLSEALAGQPPGGSRTGPGLSSSSAQRRFFPQLVKSWSKRGSGEEIRDGRLKISGEDFRGRFPGWNLREGLRRMSKALRRRAIRRARSGRAAPERQLPGRTSQARPSPLRSASHPSPY